MKHTTTNDKYYINLISFRLENFSWASEDVALCRCPICGDSRRNLSKRRFYFYIRHGIWHVFCHNCNYSASFSTFLKRLYPEVYKQRSLAMLTPVIPSVSIPEETPEDNSVWDFSSCKKISDLPKEHFVSKYVKSRKIPSDKVLYCSDVNKILAPHNARIKDSVPSLLIPYRRKAQPTEVFQIRFFDPKRKPKYLTFKKTSESLKIYNIDFVHPLEPVYVLEGPIDSMMLKNAIAVGGSNLQHAVKYLKHPILIYDNEPRSNIICGKISNAIKSGYPVVIFPQDLRSKDLNDMAMMGIDVEQLVKECTVSGLDAELKFSAWRRC